MNLPYAVLIYPFGGKSKVDDKVYLKDHGPNQLHLTFGGCTGYLEWDWLGFVSNSLRIASCTSASTKVFVDSLGPVASLMQNEFSFLLHVKRRATTAGPTILQFGNPLDPLRFGIYTSSNKVFLR